MEQQANNAAQEAAQTQDFEPIKEQTQETTEPGFIGKAWNKTQEIAGSTCATVKEKPAESAVIAVAGYTIIKGLSWIFGKVCKGKKED